MTSSNNRANVQVLQVITSSAPRGAERFAVALQPELERRGLTVRTVALTKGDPDALPVPSLGPTRLGRATLSALRDEAKRARVVVAHGSTTLPASAIATMGTKVPFVYRNIGDPYYWSTSFRRRLQSRLLLSRTRRVVALTHETANRISEYYKLSPQRISVIPRGVSDVEFPLRLDADRASARERYGIPPGGKVAICVGALSEEKNVENAIKAVASLSAHWTLLVAGDGPDRDKIEAEAAALPTGKVRILGAITDVAGLMTAADVLLLPSRTEGLPGVVIEAGMVGVPSVATNVGFVSEIITDGVNGKIVPSNDAMALAEAVELAELNLDKMGMEAHRQAVEGFSLQSTADRWHHLLSTIITSGSRAALTP